MATCPKCGGNLVPDEAEAGKWKCYNCMLRFRDDQVNGATPKPPQSQAAPATFPYAPPADGSAPVQAQPQQETPQQAVSQDQQYQPQQQPYQQPPYQQATSIQDQQYGQPGGIPVYQKPPTKGVAIAALVLGIITMILSIIPFVGLFFAGFTGVAALVCAIVALVKCSKGTGTGKGFAITGLVLSLLAIVVTIIMSFVGVGILASTDPDAFEYNYSYNIGNTSYSYNSSDERNNSANNTGNASNSSSSNSSSNASNAMNDINSLIDNINNSTGGNLSGSTATSGRMEGSSRYVNDHFGVVIDSSSDNGIMVTPTDLLGEVTATYSLFSGSDYASLSMYTTSTYGDADTTDEYVSQTFAAQKNIGGYDIKLVDVTIAGTPSKAIVMVEDGFVTVEVYKVVGEDVFELTSLGDDEEIAMSMFKYVEKW